MTLHQNVQSTITNKQKSNNGDKKQVVSKLLVIHIAQKQRASKHLNKQSNRTAKVNFIFQRNFKNVLFCCLFLTAAIFTHLLFRIYSVYVCTCFRGWECIHFRRSHIMKLGQLFLCWLKWYLVNWFILVKRMLGSNQLNLMFTVSVFKVIFQARSQEFLRAGEVSAN